mmetsp:Transcript_41011/g.89617  ORF Transcript_41011/g.89617 Transcript_41011/m.89617 type:complete len:365 (+) Transcript_41011:85-1179(+)
MSTMGSSSSAYSASLTGTTAPSTPERSQRRRWKPIRSLSVVAAKAGQPLGRRAAFTSRLVSTAFFVCVAWRLRLGRCRVGPEHSLTSSAEASDAPITVAGLLETFEGTDQYLQAAGWHREGETFAPNKPWPDTGKEGHKRTTTSVPENMACGPAGVTTVQHIEVLIPDVLPTYVMDVLLSPEYGREWNPSIRRVVLTKQKMLSNHTGFEASLSDGEAPASGTQGDRLWPVLGQAIELALAPAVVRLAGGPRHSVDWITWRMDCDAGRGFMMSTSRQSDAVAKLAGVAPGQEMCFSAVLVAPTGKGGTVIHWIQHLDPRAPKPIRKAVLKGAAAGTQRTIGGLARQAREVQATGAEPRLVCSLEP